jgi:hypothetical protein
MIRTEACRVILCSAAALFLSANVMAQSASASVATGEAPGLRAKAGDLEVRAKVVELDQSKRVTTLRKANGELVTLDIPADLKNFESVRVGDDVVLRYTAAAVVSLEPTSSKSGIRERTVSSSKVTSAAASGVLPSMAGRRTVDVLAVVSAINTKARTATLRGAKRTVTVDVPPEIDLKQIKVGDEVRATVVESAVLSVERPPEAKK